DLAWPRGAIELDPEEDRTAGEEAIGDGHHLLSGRAVNKSFGVERLGRVNAQQRSAPCFILRCDVVEGLGRGANARAPPLEQQDVAPASAHLSELLATADDPETAPLVQRDAGDVFRKDARL